MIARYELTAALEGTRRMIRLDDGALSFFDQSAQGFWKSFAAAVFIIGAHITVFMLFSSQGNLLYGVSREISTGIMLWFAYPLVAWYMLGYLDRRDRFFTYIVPFKWLQLPFSLAFLVVGLLVLMNPKLMILFYLCIGAWIFYHWRLVRASLGVTPSMALALTLFEFFLTLILQTCAFALSKILSKVTLAI